MSPAATCVPSTVEREPAHPARADHVRAGLASPVAGAEHDRAAARPSRRLRQPSHQANIVAVRCSVPASSPSSVRNSSRTPGSPVSGSRSAAGSGSGTLLHVTQPGRTITRARPTRASRQRVAGVDTLTWGTVALPPPWVTGLTALGPISATLRSVPGSSGSTSASLLSSANAAAAQRRQQ